MVETGLWDFEYCVQCANKQLRVMNQVRKVLGEEREMS